MSQIALVTTVHTRVAAVGTAGNDLTTEVARAPFAGVIAAARYMPEGTQAAAATNARKWQLVDKGLAGSGATIMAETDVLTRNAADGVTVLGSTVVTSATLAFTLADVGKAISGTGIPANTTILAVNSATSVTMSAAATAAGTGITVTVAGSLTQYVERDLGLSLTAANVVCAAGDVIAFVSTHLGTGVADPGGLVAVDFSRTG